jgi:hypothetical protein
VYASSLHHKGYPHYGSAEQTDYHRPVQTDRLGRYVLTNLPKTHLTVRVFAPKMYPQQWNIDASKSEEKIQRNFILTPAPVLAGRVLSPGVDKIWFYFVREQQETIWGQTVVHPDGTYLIVLASSEEYMKDEEKVTEQLNQRSFHNLYEIEQVSQLPKILSYQLYIRPAGYEPIFYPPLTFQRGEVTSLDISPKQVTGSLSGCVVDSANHKNNALWISDSSRHR